MRNFLHLRLLEARTTRKKVSRGKAHWKSSLEKLTVRGNLLVVNLLRVTAVATSQGKFTSTSSSSSATTSNVQPSTVSACREHEVHLRSAYVMFKLVSPLAVLTNNKEELPLKIELL
jgi:hypothetical protein